MSVLDHYFVNNQGHMIHKWHHYFKIYERHFSAFRKQSIRLLEIGVAHGGSLEMWRNYFGDSCKIYGIDVNPKCSTIESEQIRVFIGDQSNVNFLNQVCDEVGDPFDIVIDDGSHIANDQVTAFETLYPRMAAESVYLCEDLHTSYWEKYEGGKCRAGTMVEHMKKHIDLLNARHYGGSESNFADCTHSMCFYESVVVVEKSPQVPSSASMTGKSRLY